MLQRFTIALLIAASLFSFVGEMLLWEYQMHTVRKEIKTRLKSQIPMNELHRFEFTQQEFDALQWIKKNKEFKRKHNMFDVVKKTKNNDTIELWCINDTEEETLFAQLDELVKNQLTTNQKKDKKNKSKSQTFWKYLNHLHTQFGVILPITWSNYPNYIALFYKQWSNKIPVPPPESNWGKTMYS